MKLASRIRFLFLRVDIVNTVGLGTGSSNFRQVRKRGTVRACVRDASRTKFPGDRHAREQPRVLLPRRLVMGLIGNAVMVSALGGYRR